MTMSGAGSGIALPAVAVGGPTGAGEAGGAGAAGATWDGATGAAVADEGVEDNNTYEPPASPRQIHTSRLQATTSCPDWSDSSWIHPREHGGACVAGADWVARQRVPCSNCPATGNATPRGVAPGPMRLLMPGGWTTVAIVPGGSGVAPG